MWLQLLLLVKIFAVCVVNCPVDKIKISVVVANLAVAEQIGELLVHCRYGLEPTVPSTVSSNGQTAAYQCNPNGCPTTMRLNMKRSVVSLTKASVKLFLQWEFGLARVLLAFDAK
jgi:hypothetical protein